MARCSRCHGCVFDFGDGTCKHCDWPFKDSRSLEVKYLDLLEVSVEMSKELQERSDEIDNHYAWQDEFHVIVEGLRNDLEELKNE